MAIEVSKRTDKTLYPRHVPTPLSSPAAYRGPRRAGLLQQALACATHAKSPRQLALLASQVGPRRILVVHGTAAATVPAALGADLARGLGGARAPACARGGCPARGT